MIGPEQSSDFGEYSDDMPREGSRQRGQRKTASAATRSRSRKQSTRKRGGSSEAPASIVGIGHRRQRRWSW